MRNINVHYPHPVLDYLNNDFDGCNFQLVTCPLKMQGKNIILSLSYALNCKGLEDMLEKGSAKVIIRVTSRNTSYRNVFELKTSGISTECIIPKALIADYIEVEPYIIAAKDIPDYRLQEFNQVFFSGLSFSVAKGSLLAIAKGIKYRFKSVNEKKVGGIVSVTLNDSTDDFDVSFAKNEGDSGVLADKIHILLPSKAFSQYSNMKSTLNIKNGWERYMMCSYVVPAITEAICILRDDERCEDYNETVWAKAILDKLQEKGIDLNDCDKSSMVLANMILEDIEIEILDDIQNKMSEWNKMVDKMEGQCV